MAPARLQSNTQKLVTHLLDDQHSDLYAEHEHFTTSSLEKPDTSPLAVVGSSSEHEQFNTPRSTLETLLAPAKASLSANFAHSLLLEQLYDQHDTAGQATADGGDDDSGNSSETSSPTREKKGSQRKRKARWARRRSQIHALIQQIRCWKGWRSSPEHESDTLNLAKPLLLVGFHGRHSDATDRHHAGPENVRTVHLNCTWEANSAAVGVKEGGIL